MNHADKDSYDFVNYGDGDCGEHKTAWSLVQT